LSLSAAFIMAYEAGEAIVCEVNPVGADKIVLWANKLGSIDGPRTKARLRDDRRDPLLRQAITDASSPKIQPSTCARNA
jgi:hypothetical protein